MIVIGISETGHREILSISIGDSENEVERRNIFKGLKDRGLTGVSYVVSDDHQGMVKALERLFQGSMRHIYIKPGSPPTKRESRTLPSD